jgi:hypothetical protein
VVPTKEELSDSKKKLWRIASWQAGMQIST